MDEIEQLYRRYARDLYRYAISLCMNPAAAEDIVQSAFLSAIGAYARFRGDSTVKTWLFGIVYNEYRAYLRKNPAQLPIHEEIIAPDVPDGLREQYLAALEAIAKFPEKQRQIATLRLIYGMSFSEIAELVGEKENTCRVTFFRLKRRLAEVIE